MIVPPLRRLLIALLLASCFLSGCSKDSRMKRNAADAERYFHAGDYDRAEIAYKNVLRDVPRHALSNERLGTIWLNRGEPLQASRWLAKAKEISPENLAVRVQLAKALFALGASAEARQELHLVLKVSPSNNQAIVFFAETAESAEELAETRQLLKGLSEQDDAPVQIATALVALRQGDSTAGEAAVRRACELDPKSPVARAMSAGLLLSANDLPAAEEGFKQAVELAPVRAPERLKYAAFLLQTGRKDEALVLLADTTAKAPDYLPAWRMQARIALAEHRHDDAAKLLERVFARAPADLEAGLMQTEVWLTKGDGDKAVALMKQLETTFPDRPGIEFHLARAYLSVANQTLATEALDRALALDPEYAEAVLLRARLKLSQGEIEEVVKSMVAHLDTHPDDVQAQLLLVDAYRASGRLDAAAAVLKQSAESSGNDFRPHLFMGMILRSQDKNAEARESFERAQRLAPDNLLVTLQLAALDLLDNDFAAARKRVDSQLARNPGSAGAHYLSAAVSDEQKDWKQAEHSLLRAIDLESDFFAAYGLLIRVYVAAGKTEEAAEQLRHFISDNPDSVPALMQLGAIYQETGRNEDARDCYERIIRLDATFAPALNNLAILHSEVLGEPEKAYEIVTQARSLLPDEAAIADTLGWIVFHRKDYKRAFALLQEAAQAMPDDPGVQYHLGMAATMMGRAALAKTAFEHALGSNRNFPARKDAEQMLTRLDRLARSNAAEIGAMLQEDAGDVFARLSLAAALEAENRPADAASAYLQALAINPDLGPACMRLAALYGGPLKQPQQALDFARKARQLSPSDPQAAAALGKVAFDAGNQAWAYSLLREAEAGLPGNAAVLHDLAWAAYATGRSAEAKAAMKRSAAAPGAPESSAVFLLLADPDFGDPSAVEAAIKPVLAARPDHVPALMAKARLLELRSQAPEAEAIYRQVLSLYRGFAPAAKRLAIVCMGDPAKLNEAATLAAQAREVLADDDELVTTLARIKFQQRDFGQASQLLQDAGSQRSLDAGEFYLLGMSLAELDRSPEAREALQRALDAGAGGTEASKAREMLLKLKAN